MTTDATFIATIIDAAFDPAKREAILRAAKAQPNKPRPGTVREAAAILSCHAKTVQRYADRGILHEIRISPRRLRYDLNEVERLATQGSGVISVGVKS